MYAPPFTPITCPVTYDDASDARTVAPDPKRIAAIPDHGGLDIEEVIRYGKSKNVGVILYVNRRALERQRDGCSSCRRSPATGTWSCHLLPDVP